MKHVDEIRYILEGCRNGRLEHVQVVYERATKCGTAHCVAGWCVAMNLSGREKSETMDCAWDYAKARWELSHAESIALFHPQAEFKHQFAMLECLEEDIRFPEIECDRFFTGYVSGIHEKALKNYSYWDDDIRDRVNKYIEKVKNYTYPVPVDKSLFERAEPVELVDVEVVLEEHV